MIFPKNAPAANPVFFRTYSRRTPQGRETWQQVSQRTVSGLAKLGNLTPDETELLYRMQCELKSLTSGRWLWVGGTDWIKKPENFPGAYNCTGTNFDHWSCFGLLMDLAMMGSGTGANLEARYLENLPVIRNMLNVAVQGEFGLIPKSERQQQTTLTFCDEDTIIITVGDSREGWVNSYQNLLNLAINTRLSEKINVIVDVGNVRQAGEKLAGFGGTANPIKLKEMYGRCAKILNKAVGRQLNSVECCLLIDEAALAVVAGNIRRCLPEDAKISTPTGTVLMKDIQVGDLVITPIGERRVTNKFDQGIQVVYEIKTISEHPPARATANHRFAVDKQRTDNELVELAKKILEGANETIKLNEIEWKAVKDLSEKDRLIDLSNIPKTIDWINHSMLAQTYDIEVEEAHCFYVDGFLTHNSAGIKQGDKDDVKFASAKEGMWQCDDAGDWKIDPDKDALRMSNHTRVFHTKPTLEETIDAVKKQYYSGEGAIQWAGEAIARANVDILDTSEKKKRFLDEYSHSKRCGEIELQSLMPEPTNISELKHRLSRYDLNPCGK